MNKHLLVGDNPFQGVSHLSQERERTRGESVTNSEFAADLVSISLENGANGFMFSLNQNTVSIVKQVKQQHPSVNMSLYPTVPSAYEYVRMASQSGTMGLMTHVAKQVIIARNFRAMALGVDGVIRANPEALLKAYLSYEISRMKPVTGKQIYLHSLLLHEIITDMALALNWEWVFRTHARYMKTLGVKPGFETRDFVFLVKKLQEWQINVDEVVIAAPFNSIGFQMTPGKDECEKVLAGIPRSEVIGFSILASGYVKLPEAADYVRGLPDLKGIVIGVSSQRQAHDTFEYFKITL